MTWSWYTGEYFRSLTISPPLGTKPIEGGWCRSVDNPKVHQHFWNWWPFFAIFKLLNKPDGNAIGPILRPSFWQLVVKVNALKPVNIRERVPMFMSKWSKTKFERKIFSGKIDLHLCQATLCSGLLHKKKVNFLKRPPIPEVVRGHLALPRMPSYPSLRFCS